MILRRRNRVQRSVLRKISNGIIGFFITLFVLLVILFGFTQTSTFRNMLKEEILKASKNSLNGKLSIGQIDGTLMTHLILNDVSFEVDSVEVIYANKIELALNPFLVLVKRIKVTKFQISDATINILENKNHTWNVQNIVKQDTSTILNNVDSTIVAEADKNVFPFLIDVSNFALKNISFKIKKYQYRESDISYDIINYDDISVTNFNLDLNLLADINKNEFSIDLASLSFTPNLNRFNLHNLSAQINISENLAEVKNLEFITDSSSINLSAKLDGINLFNIADLKDFKNYPLYLNLDAQPFGASDLSTFIEPVDFLNGPIAFNFYAKGVFGNLDFKSKIKVKRTDINFNGKISKLETPSKLYIKAQFVDSQVDYKEVDSFLSGLELPKYPNLFVENINLNFDGEPLKFKGDGNASVNDGSFSFSSSMDIYPELIDYEYEISTDNLDLSSILGINSKLNTSGKLIGKGFDPEKSNSTMNFIVNNSMVEGYFIDTAKIKLTTIDKIVDLDIFSKFENASSNISGKLDLASTENPIYNLTGNFKNLNLETFSKDSSLTSSLNFNFDINGQSLDLDKTEGNFKLNFIDSQIGSNSFDSIRFSIDLSKIDSTRLISFKSDILDFNVAGNFEIAETFNLLQYQSKKIGYAITNKINEMNPIETISDTTLSFNEIVAENNYSQKELYLDYDFNFKDFKLIAALLNRDKVEISGNGYGYVENNLENFSISTTIDLDWLFLFKGKDVFYISGVESNFNIGADNKSYLFNNIFGSFSLNSEKMVSNININNISSDIVFNQSKAFINIEGIIEDNISTGLEGFLFFEDSTEVLKLSNFFVSYKDYLWQNRDSIIIKNSHSLFNISNFNLYNNNSLLTLNGFIRNKLNQHFKLEIRNANGELIANKFFNTKNDEVSSNINAIANITGTTINPIYDLDLEVNDFKIKDKNLGSLSGKINYANQNLFADVELIDSSKKLLSLIGNIPFTDSTSIKDSTSQNAKMELEFKANSFDLALLGNIIPSISNSSGIVNSDIIVTGTLSDILYSGYFTTKNFKFTSNYTNLEYAAQFNLFFEKNRIRLGNTYLKNSNNTKFPGKLEFYGEALTKNLSLKSVDISANGKIALLSPLSRKVLPEFYGDLELITEDNLHYKYENEKSLITGEIILGEVNLNYIPPVSSYSVTNSDFKYIFVSDSTEDELQRQKYQKLLSAISQKKSAEDGKTIPNDFNIDITIKSPNITKLSVVLSKALNQKLLADITGELRLNNLDNKFVSQGQFNILPSSMFTFYKTFKAEGSIKFTSDITNPLINITSTYVAEYINPRDKEAEPEKTAVKIKINDSVNSLLSNIATGENPLDMKIYTGSQNIEYDVPNLQYNNLDAMYFILFGTFSNTTEKSNLATSAGMSVLGSTLTTMLNAGLGDVINNVNINQTGRETRYNVSGRIQKVRYTFGGSLEEISDWSRTNAKLEYLFSPQFIMRVERKDPVISSSYDNQKINEFGMMYRFSF